jgi:hypothetical protein
MQFFAGFLAATLLAGGSPALGASELEEIRDSQKKILQRLDAQDKMLRDILARFPQRPAEPDPNEVHDIPVAHSAIKGPKTARVTIAEFSDFQ